MSPSLSSFKYSICLLLLALQGVHAVKFKLQAERYPQAKCIWNSAHDNELVIVTANIGGGALQLTFEVFVKIIILLTKVPSSRVNLT